MSIPPQYSRRPGPQPAPAEGGAPSAEDCRDYLRTGRCKYGSSCKYNHPSNVQSGGGMKAPIDPSEPMFPIRPNEPVCQYYMKHGTCKFGQACKFHHPPQTPLQAVMNGSGTFMMNVGDVSHHLVLNPVTGDHGGGSTMMVQFLPQRPDEPDCIYYLKNGRCKYGTTCRYHHPVNLHKRRIDERRPPSASSNSTARVSNQDPYRIQQKVQYVTPQQLQGFSTLPDNTPVSFLQLDHNLVQQGYQPIPVLSNDGKASYGLPMSPTEPASSASSLASSYETAAGSSLDQWNRSRRNGSGGSLAAYANTGCNDGVGNQVRVTPRSATTVLHNSASDGSIATRTTRATSHGSASEVMYYESVNNMPRSTSVGSWRTDSSIDPSRLVHPSQYQTRQEGINVPHGNTRSPQMRGQVPVVHVGHSQQRVRSANRRRGSDEGFTRMTSALLTMLGEDDESRLSHGSYPLAPQEFNQVDPAFFERLSLHPNATRPSPSHHPMQAHHSMQEMQKSPPLQPSSSWSPSLRSSYGLPGESANVQHQHQSNVAAPNNEGYYVHPQHQAQVMQRNRHMPGPSSGSDIGLYFP